MSEKLTCKANYKYNDTNISEMLTEWNLINECKFEAKSKEEITDRREKKKRKCTVKK